jgi:hypothetical protein
VDQQFEATDEQKAKRSRHARAMAGRLIVVPCASRTVLIRRSGGPVGLSGAGLKTYLGKDARGLNRAPIEFVPEPPGTGIHDRLR